MNKLFFVALFGLFALGAGCSGSQGTSIPSRGGDDASRPTQPASGENPAVADPSLSNWQSVDADKFTLLLPPGWIFNKRQGIDSYVGEFLGDGVRLGFDYGSYSNPLAEENDPKHTVTYEMIDGRRAKIVVPKVVGEGAVGVYFADVNGEQRTKLEVSGENFNSVQQEVALKLFRTLKFKK